MTETNRAVTLPGRADQIAEHRRYCWLCNPALKTGWPAPTKPEQATTTTKEARR